ncbi:MAG: hypothetical protein NVSMB24_06670 [Mucilaginibacter sp.]
MIYCIDSHLVIWGIKKQSTDSQKDMIGKTERFFQHAAQNKVEIIIPTVVVTEILAVEPEENHAAYLKEIHKGFIIADLDVRIAKKAAELMHKKMPDLKSYLTENNLSRDKMKIDHIIAATAMIHKVDYMFTYDRHVKNLCKDIIPIAGVPNNIPKEVSIASNPEQQMLFGELKVIK